MTVAVTVRDTVTTRGTVRVGVVVSESNNESKRKSDRNSESECKSNRDRESYSKINSKRDCKCDGE